MVFRPSSVIALLALADAALGANLFVSHYSGTVNLVTLTGSSLTLTKSLTLGGQPTWMTWNSTSRTIYVSDESYASGYVAAVSAGTDGSLTLQGKAPATAQAVANCQYGNGGFIAVAHYGLSQITTYKLPLSSSTQVLQSFKYTMNGKGPIPSRQDAPHPHQVTTDPTGQYLLVPDLGADQIRIYSINSATGMLTACPSYIEVGGTGPRHGTFWNNNILYVANELANTVHEFSVSYPTGGCLTLTRLQVLTTLPGNKTAPTGTKVAEVHTFDNFLYAATRRDLSFAPNDSIAAYSVANTTGTMTFMNITSSGGTYPRTFSINKAGDMVAIGDQTTANVVVVGRNVATGALGPQIASLRIGSVGTPENDDGLSDVKWDE